MKTQTILTIGVVLLLAAAAAWAIKKRQASMTGPVLLSTGKVYTVDTAYNAAGY
jgi:hypothetical protein